MIHKHRVRSLNSNSARNGSYVLYWMQQSQRAHCNHALEYAVERANALKLPLMVLFVLTDGYPEANWRHYRFMLEGLSDTAARLAERGIRMQVRLGGIVEEVLKGAAGAALLVTDRGYLRIQRQWRRDIAERVDCACIQVESDVIVPVEEAYPKEAYTAGILRPKLHARLQEYLVPLEEKAVKIRSSHAADAFPGSVNAADSAGSAISAGAASGASAAGAIAGRDPISDPTEPGWLERMESRLDVDRSVEPVSWLRGGTNSALRQLEIFLDTKLRYFDEKRNDPAEDLLSHMSPYLHFGQISPLYIALQVGEAKSKAAASFLEEMIVRRELSMNFVHYNHEYDSFRCLPDWARQTLEEHELDPREYRYSLEQLERAETHDPYWNAAQLELLHRGKMHGYMRMYWGKKILEWSATPKEAFEIALYLNNRYSLDGRDPNGFAGVAWCFGKHDRAWSERPVFGKVRYMNANGLKRKFDIDRYVERIQTLVSD